MQVNFEDMLKSEMEEEAGKAQKFFGSEGHDVEHYIFATTCKNSTHLHDHAARLSKKMNFPIVYWGWGCISESIFPSL